jgi:hypothetical protein
MSKQFLAIDSASNEDGNELFNSICKEILKKPVNTVRGELGLPVAQKVTMKDVITLIQENKLECEIKVIWDPAKVTETAAAGDASNEEDPFK